MYIKYIYIYTCVWVWVGVLTRYKKHVIMHIDSTRQNQTKTKSGDNICFVHLDKEKITQ